MKDAELFVHGAADEPVAVRVESQAENPEVLRVTVEDRVYLVEDRALDDGRSLLIEGRQEHLLHHQTGALANGGTRWAVQGALGTRSLEVLEPLAHEALLEEQAASSGSQRVLAYMPGKVVSVLAEEGQEVQIGDGIVVLEAYTLSLHDALPISEERREGKECTPDHLVRVV